MFDRMICYLSVLDIIVNDILNFDEIHGDFVKLSK